MDTEQGGCCSDYIEFYNTCWRILLTKRPEFVDKCDISKLSKDDWVLILSAQPQFLSMCYPSA